MDKTFLSLELGTGCFFPKIRLLLSFTFLQKVGDKSTFVKGFRLYSRVRWPTYSFEYRQEMDSDFQGENYLHASLYFPISLGFVVL